MMSAKNRSYFLMSKGIKEDLRNISLLNINSMLNEIDKFEKEIAKYNLKPCVQCPQP